MLSGTFSSLYGANLAAVVITSWLYGISLVVVIQYFRQYSRKDRTGFKFIAGLLCFFATLEIGFSAHQIYFFLIICYNDAKCLKIMPSSVIGQYSCVYLIKFVGQLFYASRIWTAGRSFNTRFAFAAFPVIALSLLQLAAGTTQLVMTGYRAFFTKWVDAKKSIFLTQTTSIQSGSSAMADIVVSCTLCWMFYSNRSGFKKTDTLIHKLMVYAINRAIATSFCALLNIFLFRQFLGTFYFKIPFLASAQVHVISVVSVLTSREQLREENNQSLNLTELVKDNLDKLAVDTSQGTGDNFGLVTRGHSE